MQSLSSSKYSKYIAFIGLMLTTAGAVAGFIAGSWTTIPIGLLIIGAIILVIGLLGWGSSGRGFWEKRSTQVSTNALVATIAVLVILGLVNFLAVRYNARVDLTENQILTLAPQSQQVVQELEQPLQVWIFDRVPHPGDRELLENYRRQGENFQYQYVDPQQNVGRTREFNVQSFGEVHIEYGTRRQLVQTLGEFERLSEIRLTNAIQQVQRDRTSQIYFLQGHGEASLEPGDRSYSQAVNSLQGRGFAVTPLNLAESPSIPEDANAIVIASPQRSLFEGVVNVLQEYLNDGGSLFLLIDPDTNPNLDPILQEWGVELDERVIIDGSGGGSAVGLGPATPVVTAYGEHPITENLGNGISVYPISRPVIVEEIDNIEATPLVTTNENSWGESNIESEALEFDPQNDLPGPLNIGVAMRRGFTSQEEETEEQETRSPEEPRLVVFGNAAFASDGWFDQQLNGDIFLNSVEWLTQEDEQPLSIRPREPRNRRLNLSSLQAAAIGWLALFIMPLLGFITAGVMWWRRR